MSDTDLLVPGTDTAIADLVAAFIAGETVEQLAQRFSLDVAQVEQALRGELRILLWMHGHEERPEAEEETEEELETAPAPPPAPSPSPLSPAPPAVPPVPSRPHRPRPYRGAPGTWPGQKMWPQRPSDPWHQRPAPRWSGPHSTIDMRGGSDVPGRSRITLAAAGKPAQPVAWDARALSSAAHRRVERHARELGYDPCELFDSAFEA